MRFRILISLVILSTILGCGRGANEESGSASESSGTPTGAPPVSEALKVVRGNYSPETVIVDVDGDTFTVADANMLIDVRIATIRQQIDPSRIDFIKANMVKSTVERFIESTILIHEADRLKIKATPEDQQAAMDEVAKQLPPGQKIEDAMAQSPWGREKLVSEMIASIKSKKLMAQFKEKDVPVTDEEVQAYHEQNRQSLDKPVRLTARHILLTKDPDENLESLIEKKKKIELIRSKIIDGSDFADMAAEHSDCATGKATGGTLAEFSRKSNLVQEFIDAAFSQKVNELGPVFETKHGFHLVEVTGRKEAESMPAEKVREIVMNIKRGELAYKYIEELRSKADIKYSIEL